MQVTVDAENHAVREMRPCDLVLDSNSAVVLDCGTHIFLWIGANIDLPPNLHTVVRQRAIAALEASTTGAPLPARKSIEASGMIDACVHVAHACAVGRVPVPELKVCLEGTGDERYVLSRLSPTDSMARGDLVLAQLPHLVELYEEDAAYAAAMVAHITRRLPRTDEPAFAAWATQAGVDVRAALLGEDPEDQNIDATGLRNYGGAPRSRPGSARSAVQSGTVHSGKMTPANSTGDSADELGIFSFLTRRPGDERQGVNGENADVEAGLGVSAPANAFVFQGSTALPLVATHPPPPPPGAVLHADGGVPAPPVNPALMFPGGSPHRPIASAQPGAMHEPHMYTPPQTDANGPANVVNQPFRHNVPHMHCTHASPRSPMVPMPPRPPNLGGSFQPEFCPGLSKPPLDMHAGHAKPAAALLESASPRGRNGSVDLNARNLRAVRGLQSPEHPQLSRGFTRGAHMHAGPQHGGTGAPNSHPQMQRPESFQQA